MIRMIHGYLHACLEILYNFVFPVEHFGPDLRGQMCFPSALWGLKFSKGAAPRRCGAPRHPVLAAAVCLLLVSPLDLLSTRVSHALLANPLYFLLMLVRWIRTFWVVGPLHGSLYVSAV